MFIVDSVFCMTTPGRGRPRMMSQPSAGVYHFGASRNARVTLGAQVETPEIRDLPLRTESKRRDSFVNRGHDHSHVHVWWGGRAPPAPRRAGGAPRRARASTDTQRGPRVPVQTAEVVDRVGVCAPPSPWM
eukprot:COSAG02_NODE_5751_length_4066_cov_31.002269_2_plen_131_part_00